MEEKLKELRSRLVEIDDLRSARAVLNWDQLTYMPPGGAEARARQIATLSKLSHEKFTDARIGALLEKLRPYEQAQPCDSDDGSLVRVTRREYEKAVKVPASYVTEASAHAAQTYQAWVRARPADDFRAVEPFLARMLELSRQYSGFFPGYEHIADPLIDGADEGMNVSVIRPLFEQLRGELVPLVEAITSRPVADDSCLRKKFAEDKQVAFATEVVKRFGYDFERGRLDRTAHPFMTSFSLGDVRITTRSKEDFLGEGLFSVLHEAGHAIYEQGIARGLDGTPLASGASAGVHESQSRLWENLVGRSRGFWKFFYPKLQKTFPKQLRETPLDEFYRAINKVERSLIRTDADEVTYNLHVIIRFDLELALLEGKLSVRDLPEAWRERYRTDIGVASPDDKDGVLQDVHWYGHGVGGMFQCYTLGNILGAAFLRKAHGAHPEIEKEMEVGKFETLLSWLTENIYRHGRKYRPADLVQRVTGGPLDIGPYMAYLKGKYGEIYGL